MTTLSAVKRNVLGKQVKKLRGSGQVPGILYGHDVSPQPVAVKLSELETTYRTAGESALVDLTLDGGNPIKVLIQDVQFNPLSHKLEHVDFHQVRMDEKLVTDIPLQFVGEAPAVKGLGGILVRNVTHIKVECLPKDLVHEIKVDISRIVEFNKAIEIKDLDIPAGLKVMALPDEVVVLVAPPRTEAELESIKGEVKEDVSAVGKVEKEKKAGETDEPATDNAKE
jgi:large subunit ribosomal protein L25